MKKTFTRLFWLFMIVLVIGFLVVSFSMPASGYGYKTPTCSPTVIAEATPTGTPAVNLENTYYLPVTLQNQCTNPVLVCWAGGYCQWECEE